jgi:MerR family transcriptional regulator, heat shock protein HspR
VTRDLPRGIPSPAPDAAVYVISVAAELTGLHPQTLRSYERMGLIQPGRTGGGGRRYSHHDIELLRLIADLTASGIGIEGVRRILDLQNEIEALRLRNHELVAELEGTREALRQALTQRREEQPPGKLPVLHQPLAGQSVVVWRRSQH